MLIDPEDVVLLFNFLLRDKAVLGKDNTRVIDYDSFLEALVRITILAKKKLLNPESMETESKERIKYFDLTSVNVDLVEKLLNYMQLTPGEKIGKLVKLLKSIKAGKKDIHSPKEIKKEAKKDLKINEKKEDSQPERQQQPPNELVEKNNLPEEVKNQKLEKKDEQKPEEKKTEK